MSLLVPSRNLLPPESVGSHAERSLPDCHIPFDS